MPKEISPETKLVNRLFLWLIIISVFSPFLLSGLFAQGGIYENAGVNQETIVSEILLFLIAMVFIALGGKDIFQSVMLGRVPMRSVFWIIMLSFLVEPVMMWLNMLTMAFVRNYVADSAVRASSSFFINLLYLAFVPAMVEEFLFRGLIYHGLRSLGVRKAAVVSALMFGLMHLNFNQFAYAFLLGIVLALIVEITGSLYSSMILHFLINYRTVAYLSSEEIVNAMLTQGANPVTYSAGQYLAAAALYTPIALMCVAGIFWALRRMAKACGREDIFEGSGQAVSEESVSYGFATPAFWVGIGLSVIYMIRVDLFRA